MNIKDFAEKVQNALKAVLDEEIQITETLKLNGIRRYGILISDPDSNACPAIYLEPLLEQFEKTGDMTAITDRIIQEYHSGRLTISCYSAFYLLPTSVYFRQI